jgi:hypothetical protein
MLRNQTIELLDFGHQPISNRYVKPGEAASPKFDLRLALDPSTGLISLATPFPISELVPRVPWLTYNEPESHLDGMVEDIVEVKKIGQDSVVGGISFKDDSTLARFAKAACKTWRLEPKKDLNILAPGAGVESIQAVLTPTLVQERLTSYRADILLVRHIFEHVYDLSAFLGALKLMLRPDGVIVLEVPDCSGALSLCDYTTVWEEHLYYFTPTTLRSTLESLGYTIELFKVYPFPFESSLTVVIKPNHMSPPDHNSGELEEETRRARHFAEAFEPTKHKVLGFFEKLYAEKKRVAILGAGHLTTTFISLFGLEPYIRCIIDDNPHKQGCYLPGTQLKILASQETLSVDTIDVCLLGVNPMAEEGVLSRYQEFVGRGGVFQSIFPSSSKYILSS